MNPFDLSGPVFLLVYLGSAVVALVATLSVRRWYACAPGGAPDESDLASLDPYEIAYLRDGARGAVLAAVAALIQRGRVKLDDKKLALGDAGPERDLHAERGYRAAVGERTGTPLEEKILAELSGSSATYDRILGGSIDCGGSAARSARRS